MRKIVLGKTNLEVTKTAFGALPIQRLSTDDAVSLLRMAKDNGINFFDTARAYTDSEEKLGIAFKDCREDVIIATKTHAKDLKTMTEHIKTSLKMLQTDYIDIYQFHNAKNVPTEKDSMYQYMLELKEKGIIRHIGVTAHTYSSAVRVVESGLYETLQYPISCLSDKKDVDLVKMCKEHNVGVIAMKGMGGGLIDDAKVAFSFFEGLEDICTIWGVQRVNELEEFIFLDKNPPIVDNALEEKLKNYKEELQGDFCRGCGYCTSACPVGIEINNCARMTLLCGRAVWQEFVTEDWRRKMRKVEYCMECGACVEKCPYSLDIPNLIKKNLEEYQKFLLVKGITK